MTTSNAGTFPYTDADGTVWLAFSDWGEGKRDRILMSVHGLTRQSRDFDFLSSHLKDQFRVIEVDLAGHGKSGWLANKSGYCIENFLRHIDALLDYRGISQMDWLGTGTGGLMGIILAARQVTPIRRLILNDIGPSISASSIESFRTRFLEQPVFSRLSEAEKYFRTTYAEIGPIEDAQWSDYVIHSVNREPGPSYILNYDPKVLDAFQPENLWEVYENIQCPVLLLRGQNSRILDSETAKAMAERGPGATLVEIGNCGHAPSLMTQDQVETIKSWLQETEPQPENNEGQEN